MEDKNKSCDSKKSDEKASAQGHACTDSKKNNDEPHTADLKQAVKVISDKAATTSDKKDAHSLLHEVACEAKKAESFSPAKPEKDVKAPNVQK